MKRIVIAATLSSTFLVVSPALAQGTFNKPSSPMGWIGVSVQRGKDDAGNTLEYPVIESVYPDSPADSAGLTVGDTVLKFGDIDAGMDPFGVRRLLHPGRGFRVTLRRNGVRTVTVVPRDIPPQFRDVWLPGADCRCTNSVVPLSPLVAPHPATRPTLAVVGASLTQINADLATALHIQNRGVLVIDVAPATPAMRAGLKGGDVIIKANAIRVTTPATILQATSVKSTDSSDRRVILDIVRLGKERKVTLRW